jgi:hypothetical protein
MWTKHVFLQVCVGAASVLSALSHTREAAGWYAKAMQLADLVATEEHSLQLYTLLHRYCSPQLLTRLVCLVNSALPLYTPYRDDLKALLLGINAAAIALLAIDPEMNIP